MRIGYVNWTVSFFFIWRTWTVGLDIVANAEAEAEAEGSCMVRELIVAVIDAISSTTRAGTTSTAGTATRAVGVGTGGARVNAFLGTHFLQKEPEYPRGGTTAHTLHMPVEHVLQAISSTDVRQHVLHPMASGFFCLGGDG